jgi:citrate synthase
MTKKPQRVIQSSDEGYTDRTSTRISNEIPAKHNPYITEHLHYYGYDLFELMQKRSYVDVLFLLLHGELPSQHQAQLFETLLIALINLGPRHPATRAAMNAGVGKTKPAHILPIGLSVSGGAWLGGMEVSESMQWLKTNRKEDARSLANSLLADNPPKKEGDWHVAPGFGSRFGDIDLIPLKVINQLTGLPGSGDFLSWASDFSLALNEHKLGCLITGVTAAALLDLGFHPRAGAGMFQLMSAPGLLAHGLELSNKPRTAMPFLSDENYIIDTDHD